MVKPIEKIAKSTRLVTGREYLRLLRKSATSLKTMGASMIEPHGLTSQQYLALFWISESEGLTQAELSTELDSDENTVSAMLRRMEKKQLVVRRRHTTDGRAICLFATDTGKQLVREIHPKIDRLSVQLFALAPPEHAAAILEWLEAVSDIHEWPL